MEGLRLSTPPGRADIVRAYAVRALAGVSGPQAPTKLAFLPAERGAAALGRLKEKFVEGEALHASLFEKVLDLAGRRRARQRRSLPAVRLPVLDEILERGQRIRRHPLHQRPQQRLKHPPEYAAL